MNEEQPRPIVIKLQPAPVRLSPLGFLTWARQFLQAAGALEETDEFSPVRFFLTCRAIELALKAYLLARGCSPKELKKSIGHDIGKALERALGQSLADAVALTREEREVVAKANIPYRSKRFEYFEVLDALRGFPDRPDLALLLRVAEALVLGVHGSCMQASNAT